MSWEMPWGTSVLFSVASSSGSPTARADSTLILPSACLSPVSSSHRRCHSVSSLAQNFNCFSCPSLVRSAAFILLQGTPASISVENIRAAVLRLPGVQSVHELHVWQLSETKIVASLHVWVSSRVDYMDLAMQMRKVLHDHGVHSATIQPEFSSDSVTSEDLDYSVRLVSDLGSLSI